MNFSRLVLVALLFLLAAGVSASNTVEYDHFSENRNVTLPVNPDVDQLLVLAVKNTCKEVFEYQLRGIEVSEDPAPPAGGAPLVAMASCTGVVPTAAMLAGTEFCVADDSVLLQATHEAKYGGYLATVTKKKDATAKSAVSETAFKGMADAFDKELQKRIANGDPCDDATKSGAAVQVIKDLPDDQKKEAVKDLNNVIVQLPIRQSGWNLEFAGAFTISDVVNPKFALQSMDSDDGNGSILVQNAGAEDDNRLGLAGFIHASHSRFSYWSPLSFGLGVEQGNNISYYVGTSWRLGKQAHVTLGVNWTSVDALPAGEQIGMPPTNDNVLSNLGSKTEQGAFIAFSYSFLDPGKEFFSKPFAAPDE